MGQRPKWTSPTSAMAHWMARQRGEPEPKKIAEENTGYRIETIWRESVPVLHLALTLFNFPRAQHEYVRARIVAAQLEASGVAVPGSTKVRTDDDRLDELAIGRGWIERAIVECEVWRGELLKHFPQKIREEDVIVIVPSGLRESTTPATG